MFLGEPKVDFSYLSCITVWSCANYVLNWTLSKFKINLDSSACAGVLAATAVSLFSTLSLLMMWNLLNEESAKEKCFSVCVKWALRTE